MHATQGGRAAQVSILFDQHGAHPEAGGCQRRRRSRAAAADDCQFGMLRRHDDSSSV